MTKEQEAIENLTDLLKQRNEKQVQITTYNLFENIETILSMLKEKDRKIERLEKVLDEKYIFVQGARTVYARLMSLDKEDIVKDDLALRNEIYQHIKDNEKKDKIIDRMSITIIQRDIGKNYCEFNKSCEKCEDGSRDFKCKDCIKQYFKELVERKSEEWKKI